MYSNFYGISPDTQSNSIIYQFKELLEHRIRTQHSVEYYCHELNINRQRFNTILRQHIGRTPKVVIHNRLLQEIKTELKYTEKTVAEIAYDLSFSEPNNLTRFFKRIEGVSPSVFRSQVQNDRYSKEMDRGTHA